MRSDSRVFGTFALFTMETEVEEPKKLSISHQLKFGVERLLSDDKHTRSERINDESVKNCDLVSANATRGRDENSIVNSNSHILNAHLSNGYHHSLTLNNNGNYRSGFTPSDLFMRSESFFNYFQHKNFSSRDIKQNIALFEESSAQRMQNLRPFKTDFSSSNNLQVPSASTSSTQQSNAVKRKRSWSRAVFSNLQRKGLERQFEFQKYITKPDRKKLAARLGLKDAQVKVWFQNRRMKWRHSTISTASANNKNSSTFKIEGITSSSSDEDDEIDVVSDVSYEMG